MFFFTKALLGIDPQHSTVRKTRIVLKVFVDDGGRFRKLENRNSFKKHLNKPDYIAFDRSSFRTEEDL